MKKYYVQRGMYLWNESTYYIIEVEQNKNNILVQYIKEGVLKEPGGLDWIQLENQPDPEQYTSFKQYRQVHNAWHIYELDNDELFLKLL